MNRTFRFVNVVVLALSVCALMPVATPRADGQAQTEPQKRLVNLNAATVAELESLPGVGPAVAARIIEYREKNGGFKKVEDLMNVRGIGEKTFLQLKPLVTVTPPRLSER